MGGRPRGQAAEVVYCPPPRLAATLQAARRNGAHVAFIDTAPAVESPALAAVRAADFCLIVSRPGILDLRSIGINVEIAKLAGKPVALVINAAPAQGGQAVAAGEDAHERYGVEICPIIVRQRAIFGHALVESRCAQEVEPAGKAAVEVAALWDWLARRAARQEFCAHGDRRFCFRLFHAAQQEAGIAPGDLPVEQPTELDLAITRRAPRCSASDPEIIPIARQQGDRMSRLPHADIPDRQLRANKRHGACLFNRLVGQREQPIGAYQSQRPGRLEVEHELEFDWLLDRQVGRLGAFENAIDIRCPPPKKVE